ncbi:MAG: porin [Rhodoferax sp.]|nr:porin [Rhodoferax sp.]
MAAVAAVGTSFAQVSITGSLSAATQKNLSGSSQGLAMTDNTFVISAGEDLGAGMKLSGSFTVENDTQRGAGFTRADQSVVLSTSAYTFALANTRSGGNQGAALVAPANLADDQWTSAVISRAAIDVASLTIPINSAFSASLKYVEGGSNQAVSAGATAAAVTYAGAPTAANKAALAAAIKADAISGDGANVPGSTTWTASATYAANGLKVVAQVNQSTYSDNAKAVAALTGVTNPRTLSTDLSAVYDLGVAKVGLGWDAARRGKQDGTDAAATMFGVSVPMGATTFGLNYGKRDTASFTQVAAQYDLSKRTNVNASFGSDTQSGTSGTNDQYRLSLNHSF